MNVIIVFLALLKQQREKPEKFRPDFVFFQLVNDEKSGIEYCKETAFQPKKVLLGNLNRFNENRLKLTRLIPVERDLKLTFLQALGYKQAKQSGI